MAGSAERFVSFCSEVECIVRAGPGEREITAGVRRELEALLADSRFALDRSFMQPNPERYVMYPLYVHPAGDFCVASAVWNVGQSTPVHGHETWGVVGIYQGVELETRYVKPAVPDVPLAGAGTVALSPREVTICCTSDDDVHRVACGSDRACVGIHVYGADIGTLRRRKYDPVTGRVDWFVSSWANAARS